MDSGMRSRRAVLLGSLPIGIGAGVEVLVRPDVIKPYKTRKEFRQRASQAKVLLIQTARRTLSLPGNIGAG